MNEKKLKKPELGYDNDDFENMFHDLFKELNNAEGTQSDDDASASGETDTAEQDSDNPQRDTTLKSIHKAGQPVLPIELSVALPQDRQEKGCADGPVTVRIRTKDDVLPDPDRFKCHVYHDGYYLMCSSEQQCTVTRDDCELTYEIPCANIWLTGLYSLLVSDGQYLTAKMDFLVDDNMQVYYETAEYTPCFTPDDVVASCVSSDEHWQRIASLPGASRMRSRIVEAQRLYLYNEVRKSLGGEPLKSSANYVICTVNRDLREQHLNDFRLAMGFRQDLEYIDCSTLYDSSCNNPFEHLGELLSTITDQIVCLTNLGSLLTTGGKTIVKRLLDVVRRSDQPRPLWLCGTWPELNALMEQFPSLKECFTADSWVMQQPYSGFELVQAFFLQLREEHLEPDDEVKATVPHTILLGCRQGHIANWTLSDISRLVADKIRPRYLSRALGTLDFETLPPLTMNDIDLSLFDGKGHTFEHCVAQLNEMVGLDEVKQAIITMANSSRFSQERRRRGLRTSAQPPCHCIFTGNPGTGKTTVARQLGRIYHALGLLSRGEVIAADRTRLVGRYIGETEENMKAVLEEARGNVLFIDEAYNLYDGSGDRKDFGARVIDSLLTVLSQPNPDMLVIFAGYEKEMDAMLNTNPGLSGRFPYKYRFADYTAGQLMEIATRLLERDEYKLTDEAARVLRDTVEQTLSRRTPNFSNARWMEQYIRNGILPAMANRIANTASADYQTIEAADIRRAYERFNPLATELKPRRQVGFNA